MVYYNQGKGKSQRKGEKKMKFTYKAYLLNNDIEKYAKDIEIISMEKMDLGAIVVFHCDNSKVLDEIFDEE